MHFAFAVLLLASFDCTKAATAVEKLICASPRLAALDAELAETYAAARKRGGEALRGEQRTWLKETRDACEDDGCLEAAYLLRIAALRLAQPELFAKQKPPARILGRYSHTKQNCHPSEEEENAYDCEGEIEDYIDIRRERGNRLLVESEVYAVMGHSCSFDEAPAEWAGNELRVALVNPFSKTPDCVLLLEFHGGSVSLRDPASACSDVACGARAGFSETSLPKAKKK